MADDIIIAALKLIRLSDDTIKFFHDSAEALVRMMD